MIGRIILAFIICILVLLAFIGSAALVLIIMTIQDDRELAERKRNNKQSE